MEDKSNNTTLVVALVAALMFMIALPVVFFLVKDKDKDRHDFRRPVIVQPVTPPPVAPPVVVVPVAPPAVTPPPVAPPVVVVPVPVCPPGCAKDMYSRGWEDAHYRRNPDPLMRHNPDYARGYRDYYTKHRPGIHIDLGIGFKL
jgi:hypothetical protein